MWTANGSIIMSELVSAIYTASDTDDVYKSTILEIIIVITSFGGESIINYSVIHWFQNWFVIRCHMFCFVLFWIQHVFTLQTNRSIIILLVKILYIHYSCKCETVQLTFTQLSIISYRDKKPNKIMYVITSWNK